MKNTALVLLAILLLGVGYTWRRNHGHQEQEQFEADLWRLRNLDAIFDEDLLRARFSMLENYDDFPRYLDEMDRLTASLRTPPHFIDAAGTMKLTRAAGRVAALSAERRRLFESFKSRNAVVGNSRRYFPVAVSQLSQRLGDGPGDQELQHILQELTDALLAATSRADDLRITHLPTVERMEAWARQNPSHPDAALAAVLARHAKQLTTGKTELDTITRNLLALPLDDAIDALSVVYGRGLTAELQQARQYGWLLYGLGTLLVAVIGYAFWTQRDANHRLETRVTERTRELQAEIEERRRTEEALQESQAFLNSLVDNLPVHVFRKNRDGVITFANNLFCARHGLKREQVIGTTDAELIGADDAEVQRRIDAGIMESARPYEADAHRIQANGEPAYIHLIKVPVLDATGHCVGVQGMFLDITERKRAEAELEQVNRQLLETSRHAGMAEVATGVLHNVGNVLNSVNVSATLVMDRLRDSKTANLPKLEAMLREHRTDLADYLANDPKGRLIPDYLALLAGQAARERDVMSKELEDLRKNIEHIRDIVAMQQNYAKVSGVVETVALSELVEDALRMNAGALSRHGLEVTREFEPGLSVTVERHKVLQILVNLIRNAKYACDESGRKEKRLTARIGREGGRVKVSIVDTGIGIAPENLTRIFAHGFTTKKDGHGFGLHSGALTAKELGGALTAHSDGPGHGATFTLELPSG